MKVGSLDVRWTTPVSHFAVPVAFWVASRNIKVLSGPAVQLAADFLLCDLIVLKASDIFMGMYVLRKEPAELRNLFFKEPREVTWLEVFKLALADAIGLFILKKVKYPQLSWPSFLVGGKFLRAYGVESVVAVVALPILEAFERAAVPRIAPNSSWASALDRREALAQALYRTGLSGRVTTWMMVPNWWGLHAKLGTE